MKTIGERAQEFRLAKQWNTTRMAKEVGTSRQSIENLEATGDRSPRYIAKLARVMGLTTDELMSGLPPSQSTDTQPSAGIRLPAAGALDIAAAIETVAQALSHLTAAERVAVLGKIGKMDDAFDSASLKQSIVDNLLPSTVGRAAEAFAQEGRKAA